eukprot:g1201.t1
MASIPVTLHVTQGPYAGQVFRVVVRERETRCTQVRLGRAKTRWTRKCGVCMPDDDELSSSHARLKYGVGNRVLFVDVGSTNGSEVDGRDAEEDVQVELKTGSTLRLGLALMTVTIDAGRDANADDALNLENSSCGNKPPPPPAAKKAGRTFSRRGRENKAGVLAGGAAAGAGGQPTEGDDADDGVRSSTSPSLMAIKPPKPPPMRKRLAMERTEAVVQPTAPTATEPALIDLTSPGAVPATSAQQLGPAKRTDGAPLAATGAASSPAAVVALKAVPVPTASSTPLEERIVRDVQRATADPLPLRPGDWQNKHQDDGGGGGGGKPLSAQQAGPRAPAQHEPKHAAGSEKGAHAGNAVTAQRALQWQVGASVEARFRGTGNWYPAVVAAANPAERTYDVAYDDGDREQHVAAQWLRAPAVDVTKQQREYLRAREQGVACRKFKLESIGAHECVPSGRTIKPMRGWEGSWPAIREFMQNTIDHLELLDQKTGRRHAALELVTFPDSADNVEGATSGTPAPLFEFRCGGALVCRISVARHVLEIEQHFTFPLPPRALDTGVPDTTKMHGSTAGGFGDGFKTAAVALLARSNAFQRLEWAFESQGQRIEWKFGGKHRKAVGTFAACQVLEVEITRESVDAAAKRAGGGGGASRLGENVMLQTIAVHEIGLDFVREAVPRLQVFWRLDESSLVGKRARASFMCDARALPPILRAHRPVVPEPGVYVCGIYVREAQISGSVMAFFGNALEVSGRDRNEVSETRLAQCCSDLLRLHPDTGGLATLLSSLKGLDAASPDALAGLPRRELQRMAKENGIAANLASKKIIAALKKLSAGDSAAHGSAGEGEATPAGPSWMTRCPNSAPFLDRVLLPIKEHILHTVFGFPRGCIFISSKTTSTGGPFTKWASAFLKEHGAPLVPLALGASKTLFDEVHPEELRDRCAAILRKQPPLSHARDLISAMQKVIQFLHPVRPIDVVVSKDVKFAFLHKDTLYSRDSYLNFRLVQSLKIVVTNRKELFEDHDEVSNNSEAVTEALMELKHKETLSPADIDAALKNAARFKAANAEFVAGSASAEVREAAMNAAKVLGNVYVDGRDPEG